GCGSLSTTVGKSAPAAAAAGLVHAVRRAARARARAALGRVAGAGRGTALGGGGLIGVGRAGIGGTVTLLGDVARVRRRAADCRALLIGRAGRARAGAVLRRIADAGRGAALHGRRLEGVRRTGVVHAVAALGHVAGAGARAAHRRALRIGWARRIRSGAVLRQVADAGRAPTLHRRRLDGVRRPGVVRPLAALR